MGLEFVDVSSYALDPASLVAFFEAKQIDKGRTFLLALRVKNTSETDSLKARIHCEPLQGNGTEVAFAPSGDGFIDVQLAPKEEALLEFPMVALRSFEVGSYPVRFHLTNYNLGDKAEADTTFDAQFHLLQRKEEVSSADRAKMEELLALWKSGKITVLEDQSVPGQGDGTNGVPSDSSDMLGADGYDDSYDGGYDMAEVMAPVGDPGATGSDPNVKNKPKLIISDYKLTPEMPKAGENFTIDLTFYNTNDDKSVRNIKISLNGGEQSTDANGKAQQGSVFTPVNSSNTFFIARINPERTGNKRIVLKAVPNAPAQNYSMTVNFEYEDKDGNQYTAQEVIGIPVVQQAKVLTGEVSVGEMAAVGQSTTVDMDFYNTGKDTLTTFMVTVEGEGLQLTGSPRYFVGNFAPGSSDHFSAEVIPTQAGDLEGKIVITYEDSTGAAHKEEVPFKMHVEEQFAEANIDPETGLPREEQGVDPQNGMAPGEGRSFLADPWLWLALLVAVLAGVGFVVRRRKKKKEQEDLTLDA